MAVAISAEARRTAPAPAAQMSHRQIMEALSGLLLGLFVAILSSTVVSNALPTIITDLHASQTTYTWVVTSALLATTVSTPIWGKLADLMSKKLLVQLGLVIFVAGSAIAGLAPNPGTLIAARVVQGIGAGGLTALAQVIMAVMIAPRERGRYSGYIGAVFALATIGGPLVGGAIVDTSWLGWRWCFYVGVPFAVIALLVLQKTLHLPTRRRRVTVDWAGATLITCAVSDLLVWVSFAGDRYAWLSWQTGLLVGGAVVLSLLFLLVETWAAEPIVPLRLFRNRTISLAVLSSLLVGIAMYGATVFLSQYFQLARGESPARAGIMTLPMIGGLALASTVAGQIITRTGRWKVFLVLGGALLTAGFGLMGTLRHDTPYWQVAAFMGSLGVGLGMTMQNLVLSVQNQVQPEELGTASSAVAFFRTLGGAVGVAALGAALSNRVAHYTADGLARLGVRGGATGHSIPRLSGLPAPVRAVVESAFGHGIGDVFLYAAPSALLALIAIAFVQEVPLRTVGGGRPGTGEPAPAAGRGRHGHRDGTRPMPSAVATRPGGRGGRRAAHAAVTQPLGDGGLIRGFVRDEDGAPVTDAPPTHIDAQGHTEPLGDGGLIRGFVRDEDGAPVTDAALTLIDAQGHQVGRAVTRADGGYGVPAPGRGTYVLIAAAGDRLPQAATVVAGDRPVDLDVVLRRGSLVRGTVRAEGRGPLTDARITLLDAAGDIVGVATTGADGEYAFAGLTGGRYTVVATGYPPAASTVEAAGDGVHDVWLGHRTARTDGPDAPDRPDDASRPARSGAAGRAGHPGRAGESLPPA